MIRNIKTRVQTGAEPVAQTLDIDKDSFSTAAWDELACKSLAIEVQSEDRKAGIVRTHVKVTSAEYGPEAPRAKRGPVDKKAIAAAWLQTPEGKAWYLENMPS